MTLNASYDGVTRSCVELTLTDLYPEPNGAVRIERAALDPQPPWETVRGAVTLSLLCPDGLQLTGDTGDYASAPDSAALDITGDIDLRADVTLDSWIGVQSERNFVAKYETSTDDRSYRMWLEDGTDVLGFSWSADGTFGGAEVVFSTAKPTPGEFGRLAVRATLDVDDGAGGWVVHFYTAPSIAGPWTQLGDPVDNSGGGTTSIFAGAADLEVGTINDGAINPYEGLVHAAEVYDGIDGTLVADPYFANEAAMTTSFDDSSGNTWTVNGYAEIVRDVWAQVCDYEFFAGSFCDDETVDSTNYYRAIRVEPEPGLLVGGEAGDYASTPDKTQLDVTGDIDIRISVAPDDWDAGDSQVFAAKRDSGAGEESWQFYVNDGGRINFAWWDSGAALTNVLGGFIQAETGIADGEQIVLRVTMDVDDGLSQHVVRFWYGSLIDGPWTQLGSDEVMSGTTSIFDSTADVEVGARDNGTETRLVGTVHEAKVLDGINGTEVANPDFAAQDSQTTSFSDEAGNTWTVNGDAVIYGEPLGGTSDSQTSIEPILEDIWLISLLHPNVSIKLPGADFRPVQRSSRTGIYNVKGKVNPIAIHDAWTSRWWTIETVTYSLQEAAIMDLSVLTTGTWFIQVPPECENECLTNPVTGMPGGYVALMNSTMTHEIGGTHAMEWVIFVREVTPPAPEVSGTTITWNDVAELYGSWTALWASHRSWWSLWSEISGNPENSVSF